MLKVTIYPTDSLDVTAEYIEGVTEAGGTRKVQYIYAGDSIDVVFENQERRRFVGFRYILETINDPETTENK